MRKIIALILIVSLSGCGPVLVKTASKPLNVTPQQEKIDTLTCGQQSQVTYFPFLFGLGVLISRNIARDRYTECLEKLGYTVDKDA